MWDEPFYAHYLTSTGKEHPMREEILVAMPQDPAAVIADCRAEPTVSAAR